MKSIYLLIVWVSIWSNIYCQVPSASWFDYDGQPNGPAYLFKTDYGFISFSGITNIGNYYRGCLITKLNLDGTVISHNPIWSETEDWPMSSGNPVIAANDSGFYLVLNKRISEELSYPMLLRIDNDGDTIWTKTLLGSELGSFRNNVIAQSPLGDLFFAGYVDTNPEPQVYDFKFTLMKTDGEGIYDWHYITSVGSYPIPVTILATNNEVLVGGYMGDAPSDFSYGITKDFIRKFDYDGNPQWLKKIHVPPAGAEAGVYSLIPLANGNYLYASGRSEGTLSGQGESSNTLTEPVIGELDGLLGDSILFETGFNNHRVFQKFFQLKKITDGGYIGVGVHTYGPPGDGSPIGFMIKLDANLNQEWYRYYVPSVWEGMGRWNNLTDVVENDNGTYTAIGLIYTYTGDGPQGGFIQDTYLITVDSLGCLVPGCEVSVQEFEATDNLLVYPNPAADRIFIDFPHRDNWEIRLYNQQGQLVRNEKINQSNWASFEITNLPSGFYTVKCMGADGRLFINKMIKE
jgi:hypothetical protein